MTRDKIDETETPDTVPNESLMHDVPAARDVAWAWL